MGMTEGFGTYGHERFAVLEGELVEGAQAFATFGEERVVTGAIRVDSDLMVRALDAAGREVSAKRAKPGRSLTTAVNNATEALAMREWGQRLGVAEGEKPSGFYYAFDGSCYACKQHKFHGTRYGSLTRAEAASMVLAPAGPSGYHMHEGVCESRHSDSGCPTNAKFVASLKVSI